MRPMAVQLNAALVRRCQNWFQQDIPSQVFLYPTKIGACKAFTVGSHVYLADSVLSATTAQAEHLLVHELAHVVQKQRARRLRRGPLSRLPSSWQLETEAHFAAAAFSLGEKCPPLSPDFSPERREWGPAGHYYSVYFISRLAGLSDSVAEQLAFFAQLPDQVKDLDAIVAGEAFTIWALLPPAHRRAMGQAGDRADEIEEGMHCLTGSPGAQETKRRVAILSAIPNANEPRGRFAFGLGLHALGDSYAHRTGDDDGARLYPAPFGHLAGGSGFVERVWKLGKDVDNISKRSSLYRQYCSDMLRVVCDNYIPSEMLRSNPFNLGLSKCLTPSVRQLTNLGRSAFCGFFIRTRAVHISRKLKMPCCGRIL